MLKSNLPKIIIVVLVILGTAYFFLQCPTKTKPIAKTNFTDELVGSGKEVSNKDTVEFNYQAFIEPDMKSQSYSQKFDSSYDRHESMKIKIGENQFYKPVEKALIGMHEGGKRIIKIKASDLFANEDFKKISGGITMTENSVLVYILEVVKVD
jgi:FKBP-type peptidyl-prolyl cis-trans isomerase FkpA